VYCFGLPPRQCHLVTLRESRNFFVLFSNSVCEIYPVSGRFYRNAIEKFTKLETAHKLHTIGPTPISCSLYVYLKTYPWRRLSRCCWANLNGAVIDGMVVVLFVCLGNRTSIRDPWRSYPSAPRGLPRPPVWWAEGAVCPEALFLGFSNKSQLWVALVSRPITRLLLFQLTTIKWAFN